MFTEAAAEPAKREAPVESVKFARGINETNVVEIPEYMHHFSWVRKDIHRKCRNSSARKMIERGTMLQDYESNEVGHGYYVKDYDQKLITVSDNFNLTAIFDSL